MRRQDTKGDDEMTTDELKQALTNAVEQAPDATIADAITVYLAAKSMMDAYSTIADDAKKLIGDVMTETGETAYSTQAGKVSITAASTSVSYDAKAIDILLRDDAELAMRLAPYRKESQRAGTMRITGAK